MNRILSPVVLVILFLLPTHAQRSMSGSSALNGTGSLGVGGGYGGSIGGSVSFNTLPPVPPARFSVVEVSGANGQFTPTTWTQFQQGVELGRAQLRVEAKPLGELAAHYRHQEKPKAKLEIVQDARGRAILQRH